MTFVDHSTDALAQAPASVPATITIDSPPTKPALVPVETPPQQQRQQQPQHAVPAQHQQVPIHGQFVQMAALQGGTFVPMAPQFQQPVQQQQYHQHHQVQPQQQQQTPQFQQFQPLQQQPQIFQQQQPHQGQPQPQQVYVMGPDGTLTPQLLQQPMYVLPAQPQPQPQPVLLSSTTAPPAYAGPGSGGGGGAAGRQVIVNFLAPEVTNADLAGVFQSIGPIDSARVIVDKVTGVSKQFGFVYFQRPEDAVRAAQELTGFPMMGRRIKVTIATTQRPQ